MINMRKICIIILIIMISFSIYPIAGETNQSIKTLITYRTFVDQYHGFYKVYQVYNITSGREISPQNRTLNINKGDTVIWINDALPDTKLTIVSKQKLWKDNNGTLKWSYKQFGYTFNKSGTYDIYIKERPKLKQKIIVGRIKSNGTSSKSSTIKSNSSRMNTTNSTIESNSTNSIVGLNSTNSTVENMILSDNRTKLDIIIDMLLPNSTDSTVENMILSDNRAKLDIIMDMLLQNSTINAKIPIEKATKSSNKKIPGFGTLGFITMISLSIYVLNTRIK